MSNAQDIPVWEKYTLTIEEASKYFRIGENKLRRLAEENKGAGWLIMNGNRIQIKRRQFENWTQSNANEPCMCYDEHKSYQGSFQQGKEADTMKEKRRDSKGRILHTGESQRTDGKYLYKYVDAFGNTKYVYAWRLTPTDPTPKGKREKPSFVNWNSR